jgi:hypothetical protein
VFEVDGWRLGVGICRDTGIGEHVEAMAIWSPAGDVLAQAGTRPGDLARATLT